MAYVVKVDLSAKIEQWSKNTAVAFSDGIQGSILIAPKVKRYVRDWLKTRYPSRRPAFYLYNLLAVFIYLLIKPYLQQIEQVVIDRDYPGKKSEGEIKSWLLHFLHRDNLSLRGDFISFQEVRGSTADILARRTFEKGRAAYTGRKITVDEIKEVWTKKK